MLSPLKALQRFLNWFDATDTVKADYPPSPLDIAANAWGSGRAGWLSPAQWEDLFPHRGASHTYQSLNRKM